MKPINGFKAEAPSTAYPMLPKGLYTAGIQAVKIDGTEPDQRLVLRLEIIEGEWAGYYTKRYQHDSAAGGRFEVKYKGDYALQIPDQANPKRQHYDWDYRTFTGAIWAIEDSNPGYHWDWNEQGLVGKTIGINVRQGSYNGNPYTTIGRLESTKMMAEGKCREMKDMEPRGDFAAAAPDPGFSAIVVDEEVPF